jgi:hypothetical protein
MIIINKRSNTIKFFAALFVLLASQQVAMAQPPDSIKRLDTLAAGDTICFGDTVTQYVAEFIFPTGKTMTVHGVTHCIDASSRAPTGTRIYVKEIIAVNRFGKKVRLKKQSYYVK